MKIHTLATALCLLPALASAQTQYRIDFLGSGFVQGYISGLNNNGVVIGAKIAGNTGKYQRFIGSAASGITPLPEFDAVNDINDHDVVIGYKFATGAPIAGMTYQDGHITYLNTPGYQLTSVAAINNDGAIAGGAWTSGGQHHAIVIRGSQVTDIGAQTQAANTTWATDINDAGAVTGNGYTDYNSYTFLYQHGAVTSLSALGALSTEAQVINTNGDVAGFAWYGLNSGSRPFLYSQGAMHDLGKLPGKPGFAVATVYDMNASGTVLGSWGDGGAFIYANGKMSLLDQLVNDSTWHVGAASAINDRGQIATLMCEQIGECQFALLSPVPEPVTYAMLLSGLGIVGLALRRRHRLG